MVRIWKHFTYFFKRNHNLSTVQDREVLSELISENK